jgi:hypothetical protein
MSLHLAEISAQVAPGSVAVLICDGTGWGQTGGTLQLPANVVLLPLPLYAPELNPMENVWEYLRANKLAVGVWDNYDQIVDACVDAWNWFVNDPARIETIGTREWAKINVQGGWYKLGPAAEPDALRPRAFAPGCRTADEVITCLPRDIAHQRGENLAKLVRRVGPRLGQRTIGGATRRDLVEHAQHAE